MHSPTRSNEQHLPQPLSKPNEGSAQSLLLRDGAESAGIPRNEPPGNSSMTSLESSSISATTESALKEHCKSLLAERKDGAPLATAANGVGLFAVATKCLRNSSSKQSLQDGQVSQTANSPVLSSRLRTHSPNSDRVVPDDSNSPIIPPSPELSGHLIPSRRSSLRHSISERRRSKESKRMSTSSYDFKGLNIDQDLIEEDYSAVKRIRELQEAKEKRHKEWRTEARKSEKAKRRSLPSPRVLQMAASNPGTSAIVGIVVEIPDSSSEQKATASLSSNDGTGWSSPKNHANGHVTTPNEVSSKLVTSATGRLPDERAVPLQRSPSKHRRGLSVGLRRSLTSASILLDSAANTQALIDGEVDTFLASPRLTQRIKHPRTGRTIAYSDVGDPEGFAVICCVGMGLTRYLMAFYDELARTQKLRLITPDRPGIGESQHSPDGHDTPLSWADDVYVLCKHLEVNRFSLLAHSAGAIYALATALRLPQYVRGRVHLLAPWIPPSQIASMSRSHQPPPTAEVPFTQRLLGVLPASFLKVANASFMSATSASISPKSRSKRKSGFATNDDSKVHSLATDLQLRSPLATAPTATTPTPPPFHRATTTPTYSALYNTTLSHKIWSLSTKSANPAVDLLICLERRAPIGFRYTDVTRAVVIHHGTLDTRVSVENVKWLGRMMKRCEVRVLEGEGHGLMANAGVMSNVLLEVGREWEDWARVTRGREKEGRKEGGL